MGSSQSQSLPAASNTALPSIQERLNSEHPSDRTRAVTLVSNHLEGITERPAYGLTATLHRLLRQGDEIEGLEGSDIRFASMLCDALRQFRGKALKTLVHWIAEYVIRHGEEEIIDEDGEEFQDALDQPADAEEKLT